MKKTLLSIAIAGLMTTIANAASLTWSAKSIAFDGSTLKNDSTITGYLIFLSSGSYETSYKLDDSSTASSVASAIGTSVSEKTKTSAVGKLSADFSFSFDNGDYDNGDVFGLLLVYTGASDGKTYYNLSSSTFELSGMADDRATLSTDYSFSFSTNENKGSLSSGGGWTAVPEPSTAMLALAGLALLIKRRRA